MRKLYYVYVMEHGCLGAQSTGYRAKERLTLKQANQLLTQLKEQGKTCWIDWDWNVPNIKTEDGVFTN